VSYTIIKSDGTILTTISDGTINTTSTSLGLPGRLYSSYGQVVDTNFVHMLQNFSAPTPPSNPLKGQLWYNTFDNTLRICPSDGETNANNWLVIKIQDNTGNSYSGNVVAYEGLYGNNAYITNNLTANLANVNYLKVNIQANIANANVTGNSNLAVVYTNNISTGSSATPGNITGAWTVNGDAVLNSTANTAMWVTGGNLLSSGFKSDNWYFANGTPITFSGTYSNSNVAAYLPTYGGISAATTFQGRTLTTGSNTTTGTITGNWSLSAGSTINNLNVPAANIVGAVASATTSTTAVTVTAGNQPNITGLGTVTSLTASGGITGLTLTSTATTGTSPLTVSSQTKVANLNADFLDGYNTDVTATPSTIVVRDSSGNITGNYLIGNGAYITGVTYPNTYGNFVVSTVGPSISATGTSQGDAYILVTQINGVTTANIGTGVRLPTSIQGMRIIIMNLDSANTLNVYPDSGSKINSLSTNSPYSLPAGGRLEFVALTTSQWYTLNATYG
jgi:hypothetical protein